MRPNFIGKFLQKDCNFITQSWFQIQTLRLNSCIFLPQSQLQCDVLLRHSIDIIDFKTQGLCYEDFDLRNVIMDLWRSNMSHSCIPQLSWSEEC